MALSVHEARGRREAVCDSHMLEKEFTCLSPYMCMYLLGRTIKDSDIILGPNVPPCRFLSAGIRIQHWNPLQDF